MLYNYKWDCASTNLCLDYRIMSDSALMKMRSQWSYYRMSGYFT